MKTLTFHYEGGPREAEPHCHGLSKAGNEVVRAFQIAGASESGNTTGWKLFEVDKMTGVGIGDSFEGPRPGYNPNDKAMKSVHCHI